jgi:hypothetical protein
MKFNLSDKRIKTIVGKCPLYWEDDVKEFIKRLKEELIYNYKKEHYEEDYEMAGMTGKEIEEKIDELAGEDFK